MVLQGDSLHELYQLAVRMYDAAKTSRDQELEDTAGQLFDDLRDRILHYQEVLDDANLELPFARIPADADVMVQETSHPGDAGPTNGSEEATRDQKTD
jgi:hypothetical protein